MKKTIKNHSGFTLIEAVVTVAVFGILLSMAIPSFSKMIESNRISSGTNMFMSALMLARSEAITRSIPTSICVSDTGTSCTSSGNYAKGWIVFSDCSRDGVINAVSTCDFDGDGTNDGDRIIKVHNGFKKLSILGASNSTHRFTYTLSGRPSSGVTRFKVGAKPTELKQKLTIALTGRVKFCKIGETGCN